MCSSDLHGLKSKEGGYQRTGSRTPMQWSKGPNAGFSEAGAGALYLPVDGAADAPSVEAELKDPDSLLRHVQGLIRFRQAHSALDSGAAFRFVSDGTPLVYERESADERLLIALNPSAEARSLPAEGTLLLAHRGASLAEGTLRLPAGSGAVVGR